MAVIVTKFGGSSVASVEKIKNAAEKIKKIYDQGNQLIVVVSAMGDTTDELIGLAGQVSDALDDREMDSLLSTGEQQSAALMALSLHSLGCQAVSLSGWQAGISSDGNHSKAKIIAIDGTRIKKELSERKIVVIAGFQGVTQENDVSTLGRGGSDTSAVALAAMMKADRCIIFTDVDGVYTTDPRIVEDARKIDIISYNEMLEMASLGAVVLQPRAAEFAMIYKVDVEIACSFNENPGTLVTEVIKMEKHRTVSAVASDKNCARFALFDVPDKPGIAKIIFNALAENQINVDMVIQIAMRD
ncbi:MAG: aspartate kinase, partial [Syntrophomonadaceae bacterium]|nr:aspartate kinase [Syntrophomonadaceae bacterium]